MDLVAGVKEKLTYFRIKELKDVLTQLGLSKQGKKQDLVDRILSIISDEQVSKMWAKKNAVGKEQVAKLVDDTYRKMQISGATDLASKGQAVSDSSNVKVKAEVEESFQIQSATKIRCLCGSTLETEDLIKCDDAKCKVWQHISCVIIPEKPMEGIPPVPDKFYCELCRLSRADPFWVSVSHPLLPVKLIITSIPTDGTNPVQCVEKSFQLTRADRDMVSKQEFDVEAWCMLLNDKVPFRMQWPQYTDLAINGLPVRTTNRPGSQLLGANGRDDGPIITPHTKDGINKISLTVCDPRIFCLGVRIVRRRSLQQILNLIPKEPDGEPFEDALARVCRCVGGGNAADNADSDSDLEVVSDTFSINLRCPRSGTHQQRWKEKPKTEAIGNAESVTNKLSGIHIGESTAIWKPKSYGTVSGGATVTEVESTPVGGGSLSNISRANMLEKFTVDNSTYAHARIRASFYPKFENEKSDQETRSRMIELVSKGLATLEVSLKHSGSLFMYAGHEGGAYAKNSFGNIYTAVGVFVLGRMFCEAWGTEALKKQAEFNNFLEKNHMCISMELVTAVLGDHGQRPHEDYVVVTAVTELGNGKPKFYSTPEIIAFCRKWRLPTNHVWLFSTRKSASSFFAAYDALYEEGTATSVCMALDEIADVSVPASKDHVKGQGEILEGLVARLVSHESSNHIEKILKEFPPPPADGAALDFGPSLREICAANRSDEKQQVKALLESVGSSFCPDYSDWSGTDAADVHSRNADKSVLPKFLQAHPADYSTKKLQEIIRLMREKRLPAAFKCYHNFHKVDATSNNNLFYKMVIHVHSDSAFRRYQNEMRKQPGLWPLYRGFFVDINLFKADKEKVTEISKDNSINESGSSSTEKDDFADEDANLMVKLKFLTYKLRTFLIRNGLSTLFREGTGAYEAYYVRQMKKWGISPGRQRELSKMLDEWALYITRKCGKRQLSSSIYLSEAEPFLEQFAKRCPQNQALIGSAGNLVRTKDFLAIVEGGQDEEGDLVSERDITPSGPNISVRDTVPKDEGMIVFFPGIPGCAKSALCKELLNTQGGLLGDDRPVHSLMGDLIKGKYWQKIAEERKKKPKSILLADKNAPNEEVWRQIEDMCRRTRASAVPVVPESEGTDSNPFSLDALAVFMFRVLQRVNHPGNLDKASPNAGYVLLMFYHLYDGKSRKEFEGELIDRFGSLVKIPLLKSDRNPLPEAVQCILEEGLNLYRLHTKKHGRLESTKGTYAMEWTKWEKQLRDILSGNADYLNTVQVPFEFAVKQVLEQLRNIAKGDYTPPDTEKRTFSTIVFAALSLPVIEIQGVLNNLAKNNPEIDEFLKDKHLENLNRAHLTLAHNRSHGIKAVADYGMWLHKKAPVELTALLYSDKMAAFEAFPGSVEGEKIVPKNTWPHITLWTSQGVSAKEANMLPQLFAEGKANRIDLNPPINVSGSVEFY